MCSFSINFAVVFVWFGLILSHVKSKAIGKSRGNTDLDKSQIIAVIKSKAIGKSVEGADLDLDLYCNSDKVNYDVNGQYLFNYFVVSILII